MLKSITLRFAYAFALSIMLAQAPARADLYIGAGAYQGEAQVLELDDNDTTTGFTLGYVLVDSVIILSGEVGYYDLGSYSSMGVEVEVNGNSEDGDESFAGIGFSIDLFDTLDIFVEYLEFDTTVNSELVGAGIRLQF